MRRLNIWRELGVEPEADPEQARGTTYPIWPWDTSGSPRESWKERVAVDALYTQLGWLPLRQWVDGSMKKHISTGPSEIV